MSDNILEYKGFKAAIEFSADDNLLVGKLLDIEALVMFSAESPADLHPALAEAVDEYLEDCKRRGVEPEKPYKGTFNVRVGPELHRDAVVIARRLNESLNALVSRAILVEVQRQRQVSVEVNAIRWLTTTPLSFDSGWIEESAHDMSKPFALRLATEHPHSRSLPN